jgi:hypothetical protein
MARAKLRQARQRALHTVDGRRRLRIVEHEWVDLVLVEAVVVAVFLPYLTHLISPGVFGFDSGLAGIGVGPWLGHHSGLPWIDPNVGFVSQALGHRAALDLLHGHLPWWNPYEGVGFPLTGGGQSAGLFPFTPLLAMPDGQLYFHLVLQLVAGAAMQRFLKEMGLSRWVSVVGGILFALNGTFAWLTNAAFNPIAFLPVILWGIERCRRRPWHRGASGWLLIAGGTALSLYAGFPETAYLDLAFVGLGLGAGAALAAPFMAAFSAATRGADIGGHASTFSVLNLPSAATNILGLPYLFGPIFAYNDPSGTLGGLWGEVGGYVSAAVVLMALYGLLAGRGRALRAFLAGWIALSLSVSFNLLGLHRLADHLPLVARIAVYRYAAPSWELAAIVAACLGLQAIGADPAGRLRDRSRLLTAGVVTCAALAGILLAGQHILAALAKSTGFDTFAVAAVVWALATVVTLVAVGIGARPGLARLIMGLVLVADAAALFVVPYLSAPTTIPVDLKPVAYLEQHLGLQRFTTVGPITPNYGSYFGIAEVNSHDLPTPGAWARYIRHDLNGNERAQQFDGVTMLNPKGRTPLAELRMHVAQYEAIGVAYVIASSHWTGVPGTRVFADWDIAIYRLPHPAPFWSAAGCRLSGATWGTVTVSCSRATVLDRDELSAPGSTATVNGRTVPVAARGPLFQSIRLPAGRSRVTFNYVPPGMGPAGAVALSALGLAAVGLVVPTARRRWRQRRLTRHPSAFRPGPPVEDRPESAAGDHEGAGELVGAATAGRTAEGPWATLDRS